MEKLNSGIYKILCIKTNKFYIGSAKNLKSRWKTHYYYLNKNKHHSRYLQSSWNKYSSWAFEFQILEYCEPDKLVEREQFYIDTLKPEFNLAPKAGSNLGVKYTEESKKKMSAWQIGRKMSDEAKFKMSLAALGRKNALGFKHTEETRKRMSEAQKGKVKHSAEARLKISIRSLGNKSRTGQKLSEEEKFKKRKPEKWPHGNSKCPCRECLDKRNAYMLNRYYKKKYGIYEIVQL